MRRGGERYDGGESTTMTDEELERWTDERVDAVKTDIDGIGLADLRLYAKEIAAQIVIACADAGATDWPADLHLGDVVEKHLMRSVVIPEE
jgi:hypothetical protein